MVAQAISPISGSPVPMVQTGQILMALLQLLMMHQPQAAGTTYYRVVIAAADGGCEDSTLKKQS